MAGVRERGRVVEPLCYTLFDILLCTLFYASLTPCLIAAGRRGRTAQPLFYTLFYTSFAPLLRLA